jgi:hypothetical protein
MGHVSCDCHGCVECYSLFNFFVTSRKFDNFTRVCLLIKFPLLWWIITVITIMSSIVVSPDTALVFDVEGIIDVAQSTAMLSYHNDSDDSILIFEVQSNWPTRYCISSAFGGVHNNQMCIVAVELANSDMGLVHFFSTIPGDFFLEDQIILLVAKVHGSTASTFTKLPVAEMAEAIPEYFLVNTGYLWKELFVEDHFGN